MGRSKAWLPFGPEYLLTRVVRLAGQAAGPVVVVAAQDQDLPPLPSDVIVVRDPVADRGPLQGLSAGCEALPAEIEWTYATSTDAALLQPAWIEALASRTEGVDLVLPDIGGFPQPLAALYRVPAVRPAIERLLAADRRRPFFLTQEVRTSTLHEEDLRAADPTFNTLRNLNTVNDYQQALVEQGFEAESDDSPVIEVELFGIPRLRAGVPKLSVRACTVGGAVDGVVRQVPALMCLLDDNGALHPAYRLSLNGERFLSDRATPLQAGDILLMLAADVGG